MENHSHLGYCTYPLSAHLARRARKVQITNAFSFPRITWLLQIIECLLHDVWQIHTSASNYPKKLLITRAASTESGLPIFWKAARKACNLSIPDLVHSIRLTGVFHQAWQSNLLQQPQPIIKASAKNLTLCRCKANNLLSFLDDHLRIYIPAMLGRFISPPQIPVLMVLEHILVISTTWSTITSAGPNLTSSAHH
jgi:hypothetical protein